MTEPMQYAEVVGGQVVHVCTVYRADDEKPPALTTIAKATPAGATLKTVPSGLDVQPGWEVQSGQFVEPEPDSA